jgi:hypothetical protein
MKMTPSHFNKLRNAIMALPPSIVPREDKHGNEYSDVAYRWLLFWHANPGPTLPFRWLHEFYNDDHIDTALRKIVNEEQIGVQK